MARPFQFSPGRFEQSRAAGERSRRGSGYTHLPFGGGPTACIGEHLAMAELVAAVAAMARRYRLRSVLMTPNTEVDLGLRPGRSALSPGPGRGPTLGRVPGAGPGS